jgi:hypothetical protein
MDDAKLPFNMHLVFTHLITQYLEHFLIWSSGPDLKKKESLYFELMICDKYRGKNTGPQCINFNMSDFGLTQIFHILLPSEVLKK